MARDKSPLRIQLEYYPAAFLFQVLRRLPFGLAELGARLFLRLLLLCLPKRRALVQTNLHAAFPEKSGAECQAIAAGSLRSIARGLVVFTRLPDVAKNIHEWVSLEGKEHLQAALSKKLGMVMFTAHYACWELVATYLMRECKDGSAIMRPLDNPKLNDLVSKTRSVGPGLFIPRRSAFRDSLRILKKNGTVGIVVDQNFAPGGVFVPFFGRLAATSPIVSVLARRSGAAVIPVHGRWDGRRTRLIAEPAMPLSAHTDPEVAVAEDTYHMTRIVEKWIREDPVPWLWLHNRWKRRPLPGETTYDPEKGSVEAAPQGSL